MESLAMRLRGAFRKYRQMCGEIEEGRSHNDIRHSAWKLGSFLADDLPEWREAKRLVDEEDQARAKGE